VMTSGAWIRQIADEADPMKTARAAGVYRAVLFRGGKADDCASGGSREQWLTSRAEIGDSASILGCASDNQSGRAQCGDGAVVTAPKHAHTASSAVPMVPSRISSPNAR
jgi:hypothetical protein